LKSAVHKILIPVVLLAGYVGVVVWLLEEVGFWNRSLLKDTLVWFMLVGVVLPFSFVTGKYSDGILDRLMKESIGVLIIVEFLISTYTFPLPVELVIVPIITFLAMMDAVAESKAEYAPAKKLTGCVLSLFGLVVATIAVRHAILDYRTLETVDTVRQFLLPLVLSLSLGPYIYLLLLYVVGEDIFTRVGLGKDPPSSVRWYAVFRVFRYVGLRPRRAREFWRIHAMDLLNATTRSEIDSIFSARIKQPPPA
jgi:hypothetical protein